MALPWVGLPELSMPRMMPSGGRRSCTRSIQAPDTVPRAGLVVARLPNLATVLEAERRSYRLVRRSDFRPAYRCDRQISPVRTPALWQCAGGTVLEMMVGALRPVVDEALLFVALCYCTVPLGNQNGTV